MARISPERAGPHRPRVSEHRIQVALFQWARFSTGRYPALKLLFAIPNGGARDPVTGARLKAEGVKRGVPDVFLPQPVGAYHGLFLELKAEGGRPSPEQREWLLRLRHRGYGAAIAQGLEEAIEALTRYLEGRFEQPAGDNPPGL